MPAQSDRKSANAQPSSSAGSSNEDVSKQASSLKSEPRVTAGQADKGKQMVRTLIAWRSPLRPFRQRGKEYFKTLGAILFLVCVILLFFKEWLLIMAIGAFYFITYVFGRYPPEEVEHKITTQGVTTGGRVYLWRELSDFWFTQNSGQSILNVGVFPSGRVRLTGRLLMLLGGETEEKLKEILAQELPYREIPERDWLDNASTWLAKKIPLEKS